MEKTDAGWFNKYGNWARSTEMALYSSVPRMAIIYDSLIFTGENQSLRDPNTLGENPWDYNLAVNQNTLNSGNIDWMYEVDGIWESELTLYQYPSIDLFKKHRLQIVDLGWFIKDWNNMENARFSAAHGLSVSDDVALTGDPFGVSALDDDWVAVNQMLKYLKFGYGKATDYKNEIFAKVEELGKKLLILLNSMMALAERNILMVSVITSQFLKIIFGELLIIL